MISPVVPGHPILHRQTRHAVFAVARCKHGDGKAGYAIEGLAHCSERTWVDLRPRADAGDLTPLDRLIWGITGSDSGDCPSACSGASSLSAGTVYRQRADFFRIADTVATIGHTNDVRSLACCLGAVRRAASFGVAARPALCR